MGNGAACSTSSEPDTITRLLQLEDYALANELVVSANETADYHVKHANIKVLAQDYRRLESDQLAVSAIIS